MTRMLRSKSISRRSHRTQLMVQALERRLAPATFNVTNAVDSGIGSLRQAISDANGAAGTDDIVFDPTYFAALHTISLLSALPTITDSVNIIGTTAANCLVGRGANIAMRIFTSGVASGSTITISNVTIFGGSANLGGGINAGVGNLTLTNCFVANNTAMASGTETYGGGIYVATSSATITLTNCTISDNTAVGSQVTVGGGIFIEYNGPHDLVMDNCTVVGNTAFSTSSSYTGSAGGLFMGSTYAIIRNSTITGNSASNDGGGIETVTSSVLIQNCTIAYNFAKTGGGIAIYSSTLAIESTIVAKNVATTSGNDIYGNVLANYSLIGVRNDGPVFAPASANCQTGTTVAPLDPLLTSLGNYGGPTQTRALLVGSPALNAGSNPVTLVTDQRGAGFVRVFGGQADIGAFETQNSFAVLNANDNGAGSLRQAIVNANANPGADSVTFDPSFFSTPRTITLTTGELLTSEAVTITGPGSDFLTVCGNKISRIFNISSAPLASQIEISGMTLTDGKATDFGGAIRIGDESVTIRNCVLNGNEATLDGGAIATGAPGGAKLLIEDSTFAGNTAGSDGGAVSGGFGSKSMTIRRSTISGNTAARNGGGVAVPGYSSFLVENSTVSGNQANSSLSGGGGIMIAGPNAVGALVVRNTTISGNTTLGNGGGLLAFVTRSGVIIQNSTITGNTAQGSKGGGGIAGTGFNSAYYGYYGSQISLESCIVSGNTATANGNQDLFDGYLATGAVTAKFSAIGSSAGVAKFSPDATTIALLGADFKLGPLASNGGPTKTHALFVTSPCIGAGSNPSALAFDQRGTGFVRTSGAKTDIGAYENQLNLVVITADDSGPGSLRQAIIDADAIPGADTITFDPVFFATAKTITLTGGELLISDAVSIVGPSAELTLDAGGTSRLFNTTNAPNNAAISMSRVNLANGNSGASNGGGIVVGDESLSLNQVTISNCTTSGDGGGIYTNGQQLALNHVTITNCKANWGGGIFAEAAGVAVTIADSAITSNTGGALGGGIFLRGTTLSSGSLSMVRSTISNNLAGATGAGIGIRLGGFSITESTISDNIAGNGIYSGYGGGIDVNQVSLLISPPPSFIINSTLSNNQATHPSGYGYGGAIAFFQGAASLTISNCTITGNSAPEAGGGLGVNGQTKFTLSSSIVAGNISDAVGAVGPDIRFIGGTTIQGTNNIVGVADDGGFTLQPGNLTGTKAAPLDAKLGPLADNGGPTKTHALLPGSPCIDAGGNPNALTTDQRGVGFARQFGGAVDIGAFEVQGQPTQVASIQVNDGSVQRSRVTSLVVAFDTDVALPANPADAFQLKRQGNNAIVTLNATLTAANLVTITFTGGPVEFGSLADGRYTLTVLASQVNGGYFDGNGDGMAGDDYVLIGTPANGFFRLFGDANGDGTVAAGDFIQFRLSLGGTNNIFDFDNDGSVAASDFIQFRLRFGGSI